MLYVWDLKKSKDQKRNLRQTDFDGKWRKRLCLNA